MKLAGHFLKYRPIAARVNRSIHEVEPESLGISKKRQPKKTPRSA
jgi:hypothetical protein